MNTSLYNPFKTFDFKNQRCFLSGSQPVQDFRLLPDWLLEMASLTGEEQIQLLDESIRSYKSLIIPVSSEVYTSCLEPLEKKVERAFERGYVGVRELSDLELFQWIGKMMYGFLYLEMQGAIRLNQLSSDGVNMSQGLMHKFGNLHSMLQSINREVVLEDFNPWSIVVVPLDKADTAFSFRDEINTLTFSLKFKDFGIIACLQDNGTNRSYHREILESIAATKLSEQQFEEIAARFYYSAYLFNRLPEYTLVEVEGVVYIDAMPLKGSQNKALFDGWSHKTYGQVLENFWKPWGHTLFEIIKDPTAPISYFNPSFLPAQS